ncbi:Urea carboxylase-related ABC transporter, permease protein [hydrothermal vent metagenome]|uniref:Urea carboxylase-related ABC transporter, permease protein n=1 Tax=hydrothermal vent metagenome TaxID=652676 RepID=A0A3B1A070_9ZZZZ
MSVSSTFKQKIKQHQGFFLAVLSFIIPLAIWSIVSYVPYVWHPKVEITVPGDVSYFSEGLLVDRDVFEREKSNVISQGNAIPEGLPANPIYFPAPDEVATAFYTAFVTEPKRRNEKWLHESLWDSIQVIFWGFVISSIFGVPLGVLMGTYRIFAKINEPFIEFFRYLPAPAFGALAVAILGIHQGPKIAIIFIGTFFQQVLVIANTTRKLDPMLVEAALTLGAKRTSLLFKVIVPGISTNLFRDLRILLGWAWTYLIVAELIGSSSGITWFITQQARYKNFDNVYAAIMMIGIIGLFSDIILGWIGKRIFPWEQHKSLS